MGTRQTELNVLSLVRSFRPALTVTCGFAGGLDTSLASGDCIYSADPADPAHSILKRIGAKPCRFHHVDRIAATASDKASIRKASGADAVDMESRPIREECSQLGLRSITLRVISDTAQEDLPVDFNQWTRPDQTLNPWAVARGILGRPSLIPKLIGLRRRLGSCAERLAETLEAFLLEEAR